MLRTATPVSISRRFYLINNSNENGGVYIIMNDMTLNWYKSIKNRTSVREFSDTVDQKTFTELKKFAAGLNNDEARLVLR